ALSDDAVVGNDVSLRTVGRFSAVNPGEAYGVNTTALIPSSTTTGLKNLIFISDVLNQTGDVNRANNVLISPLAVVAPSAAGPVTDLVDKVQSLINGQLIPTAVNAAGTSVTFD